MSNHAQTISDIALMYGAASHRIDFSILEQRVLAHMTMSRDRVIFTLDTFNLDSATSAAFRKAFGMAAPVSAGNVQVRCRPSQFARFLIYRNDEGGKNGFKNLAPRLVPGEDLVFDVSKNPAER